MNKKIGIIGLGNMGRAFYDGLSSLFPSENLLATDTNTSQLTFLPPASRISDVSELIATVDILVLAIKPQSFSELMSSFTGEVKNKWVISLMAGVSLGEIDCATKAGKTIRCMPNIGIQIQQGIIGWVTHSTLKEGEKEWLERCFSTLGEPIALENEEQLDHITALSGSGPAYFFYLCELLEKQARAYGFTPQISQKLAEKTMMGAALLLQEGKSAREWKRAVTSKGGTTEAALDFLKAHHWEALFSQAIDCAYRRAEQLKKTEK